MNNFDKYVSEILCFDTYKDTATYEERSGPPKELPAVIGLITLNFQLLEDEISARISQMLGTSETLGDTVVSELAFQAKARVFASLVRELKGSLPFNLFEGKEEEHLRALMSAVMKCSDLRNQVIHSSFIPDTSTQSIERRKKSATMKHGFRKTSEQVDIPHLYNISDYFINVFMEVDLLCSDLGDDYYERPY